MATEENIELRPEESAGGFEPGDSYDDSFILNDVNEYPGELPYEFIPEITEPVKIDVSNDVVPESEIPSEYDEEIENEPVYIHDETDESEILSLNAQYDETDNEVIPHVFVDEDEAEEHLSLDKLDQDNDEDKIPSSEKLSFDEDLASGAGLFDNEKESDETLNSHLALETEPENISHDKLDPEFLAMLSDDLNLKQSRETEKNDDSQFKSKEPDRSEDFNFDNFLGSVPVIDLSVIDADHPSKAGLEKIEIPEVEKETIIPENSIEEIVETKSPDEQKVEKKKPVLLWKVIAVSAAVVIFLASSVVIGYYILFNTGKFFDKSKNTPPLTKADIKQTVKKVPEVKVAVPKKDTAKPLIAKAPVKETYITTLPQKPKEIKPAKPVLLASKHTNKTNKPVKPVVQNNMPKEIKKPVQKAVPPKPVLAKAATKTSETKGINKTSINNEQPQFVVEIYSTPSKEDAEDWLGRLKAKKTNGTITTQKIRDIVWYKVRFGNFTTREQAKLAAVKLGFAQSWIDRIR